MGSSELPRGMSIPTPDIPANTPSPTLRRVNYIAEIMSRLESFADFEISPMALHIHETPQGTVVELTLEVCGKGGKGNTDEEDD